MGIGAGIGGGWVFWSMENGGGEAEECPRWGCSGAGGSGETGT